MKLPEIICTFSLKRCTTQWIDKFYEAGMTIARINASHTSPEELELMLKHLDSYRQKHNAHFKIMLDLPGPEFRLFGYYQNLKLSEDQKIVIASQSCHSIPPKALLTNYHRFDPASDLNQQVSFMNGEISGVIVQVQPDRILVKIINKGILRPNAHFKIKNSGYQLPFLSEHDLKFIQLTMNEIIDQLALSMVHTPDDIEQVRSLLIARDIRRIPQIVVKFETRSALDYIHEIIDIADAFFVARGDLGLEIGNENLPIIQKKIISLCNKKSKPVYVTTQILSSMLNELNPSHADISDIANACLDGANGITLCEETAIGDYPIEAVSFLNKVIHRIFNPDYSSINVITSIEQIEIDFWEALLRDDDYNEIINDLSEIAERIWQKGWAEASSGNISFRLDKSNYLNMQNIFFSIHALLDTNRIFTFSDLDWYLVSATGSRYREYKRKKFENFVLIGARHYNKAPIARVSIYQEKPMIDNYNPMIVFPPSRKPTSEWTTHHLSHDWLMVNRPIDKAIIHCHLSDWIIISNMPDYRNHPDGLIKRIRFLLPELDYYFPKGFVLAEYALPGSCQLAEVTIKYLPQTDAIVWEKHGVIVTAPDFNTAYDKIELLAKAADIYLKTIKWS